MHYVAVLIAVIATLCPCVLAEASSANRGEAKVNEQLDRQKLDRDAFPERAFRARERGLRAELVQAGTDPRIPAPPKAVVLLVTFRVQQPQTDPGWWLDIESLNAQGEKRSVRIALVEPPRDTKETDRVPMPQNLQIPPGLMYGGAFWVDLSGLRQRRLLEPGHQLHVRYGNHSTTVAVTQ
jgi:hypothetical protein